MKRIDVLESIEYTLNTIDDDVHVRRSNEGQGARRALINCKKYLLMSDDDDELVAMLKGAIVECNRDIVRCKGKGLMEYLNAKRGAYVDTLFNVLRPEPEPEPRKDEPQWYMFDGRKKLWAVPESDKIRIELAGRLETDKGVYVHLHFIPWN